jgi:putative ABC transport system permease protein
MALGAEPLDVIRLVLEQGGRIASLGILIGVIGALSIERALSSLLFGVSATDPATFALATSLLCLGAFAACYIPARRAANVDPMVALRYE